MVKGSKTGLGRQYCVFLVVGRIAYGAFMARSRALRKQACSWRVDLLVAAGYPFIQITWQNANNPLTLADPRHFEARLGDLTEPQRAEMEQNLHTWKMKRRPLVYHRPEKERLDESITLAEDLVPVGYSIESQWDDWHHYFVDRQSIDNKQLKFHVIQLGWNNRKSGKKW